ncbi:hypothetical protein ASPACDRAFT_1886611 [Aspergillus aculeatus ATCC 16872]|uniref:Rhodopsin domain-containing protein n=1 Tax=Aspergillus aculeatus (strain ATCC 16872 / CBS 172.66 / WB 5094) TaxID=690307 RepID=A0A1L9X174_ASPA1|nr:uncharacterized protein ASPACDRAFT_1886611 [Aspergillus aculeatus ATCC 16872]OJK02272.1 hypothetical protein ASPACDRAFT_1886611 [Aspergillus aculeatus ATCC 16872]
MQVLAFLVSLTGLATIAVVLRLWTRLRLRSAGWDDLLIVVALAANLVLFSCRVVEIHHGLGHPGETLTPDVLQTQLKGLYFSLPFYNLTLLTSKLSALALYTRLFRLRRVLLTSYSLAGLLCVAGTWIVLSAFLFCLPVRDFWSVAPDHAPHCLPKKAVWLSNGAFQVATHVVVLAIPLIVIPKLTLRRRVKAGLFLLFGLGLVVVVISIVQLITVVEILTRGGDLTHKSRTTALLASTEASASILCACMPPLYPLFSRACSRCLRVVHARVGRQGAARHYPQTVSIHLTRPVIENPVFYDGFRVGGGSYTASVEVVGSGV